MLLHNMRNEFKDLVSGGHLELTYLDASSHFSDHFSVVAQVPLHVENWSIFSLKHINKRSNHEHSAFRNEEGR